ncbi:PIG-L deacetylase family protein [Cystobacter fuscus]|uniref:PIG-L deacetylase family protein n=1 Tax=Cystobacter fuscus TaxID=43 RepID=UPI002B2EA2AF|nr:PIG-L family deacetylase [Cystobacter fuscus]
MRGSALIRALSRQAFRSALARSARRLDEGEMRRPAMVFAPHPDDETLGCGGTILLKRRLDVPVRIVFVTDGSGSHPELLPPEELSTLRAREALEASELLGVDASRVHLLGFPDRYLLEHREEAISRVVALLEEHRPEQLFVPYAAGENPDHGTTCLIVHEALRRVNRPVTVFEYAVWSWRYWPNVRRDGSLRDPRTWVRNTASTVRGLVRSSAFRTCVNVHEVLAGKRAALARHTSQLERRHGDPRWVTLRDVDGGEFLECFFDGFEFYRRIDFNPRPIS